MSLREQASQRRQAIYNEFLATKFEHDAVHINALALSVKYGVNKTAILNDVRYMLDNNLIVPYIPTAQVYKVVRKHHSLQTIDNTLPVYENIATQAGFTPQEHQAIEQWEQHRKNINKPMDSMAYEFTIAELKQFKNNNIDIIERIKYSIAGGYSKIYPPKNNNQHNQLTFKQIDEQNRSKEILKGREMQKNWFNSSNNNQLKEIK